MIYHPQLMKLERAVVRALQELEPWVDEIYVDRADIMSLTETTGENRRLDRGRVGEMQSVLQSVLAGWVIRALDFGGYSLASVFGGREHVQLGIRLVATRPGTDEDKATFRSARLSAGFVAEVDGQLIAIDEAQRAIRLATEEATRSH